MFKKNNLHLKKDFRKLLQLTDSQYQSSINVDEQRTIILMWSRIIGDNECITVTRFKKLGSRLGIKIESSESNLGYIHKIYSIADKSCISNVPVIQSGDTLLEVNGINLLLLNYDQLALTLGGLPNNMQFVLWKKEGEGVYEKPDNGDISFSEDPYHLDIEDSWRSTLKIVIQNNRTKSHGLEFTISNHRSKNSTRSVISKINEGGYFYDDQRICVNDSILELNGTNLKDYSDKEMHKIFSRVKRGPLTIAIRKCNSLEYSNTMTSIYGSKFSIGICSKESLMTTHSTPNMKSLRISKRKPLSNKEIHKSAPSLMLRKDENVTVTVTLDQSDDIKIYLVDVQTENKRKCIICGFHPSSTLRRKFQFQDQIIKVNDEEVLTMSSKEIGLLLKKHFENKDSITIVVSRKSREDKFESRDSLIAPSDILTIKSETTSIMSNEASGIVLNDLYGKDIFNVTLCKQDNSFGLKIVDQNGPTIIEVISGSSADKSGLVKVADKIIKINEIYVMDKEQRFVMTMIRSCGDKINIELLRKSSQDSDIQFMENQTYFCSQDIDSSASEHFNDSKHSITLPLPPIPDNDLCNETITKKK